MSACIAWIGLYREPIRLFGILELRLAEQDVSQKGQRPGVRSVGERKGRDEPGLGLSIWFRGDRDRTEEQECACGSEQEFRRNARIRAVNIGAAHGHEYMTNGWQTEYKRMNWLIESHRRSRR